jgi:hypothetical protein
MVPVLRKTKSLHRCKPPNAPIPLRELTPRCPSCPTLSLPLWAYWDSEPRAAIRSKAAAFACEQQLARVALPGVTQASARAEGHDCFHHREAAEAGHPYGDIRIAAVPVRVLLVVACHRVQPMWPGPVTLRRSRAVKRCRRCVRSSYGGGAFAGCLVRPVDVSRRAPRRRADDFVAGLARRECLRLATASLPSPNAAGRPPRFKGGHSNKKSLGEPTRTTTPRRGSRMASSASGLGHPTTWRPPKTRSLQDTVARLAADSARGSRDGVFPGLSLKRTTGLEPATLACEADVLPTELRPRGGRF